MDRAKSPWYSVAWHRFKRAMTDFFCVIGLILAIIGSCLFLLAFGVWVLVLMTIIGVTSVLVALASRL